MEAKLLAADVSSQTHDSIVAQITPKVGEQTRPADQKSKPAQQKQPDANTMAGLLLGSPEFQRR
jgi:hypothetical protein